MNFINEAARQSFEFVDREIADIHTDAAFGTAVRNIDDGSFPRHQRGESEHFIGVDFVVVAKPAFHGSAGAVVLHAVPDICGDLSIIAADGHLNFDFAFGCDQQVFHAV